MHESCWQRQWVKYDILSLSIWTMSCGGVPDVCFLSLTTAFTGDKKRAANQRTYSIILRDLDFNGLFIFRLLSMQSTPFIMRMVCAELKSHVLPSVGSTHSCRAGWVIDWQKSPNLVHCVCGCRFPMCHSKNSSYSPHLPCRLPTSFSQSGSEDHREQSTHWFWSCWLVIVTSQHSTIVRETFEAKRRSW